MRQCSFRSETAKYAGCCEQVYYHGEAATICPDKTLVSARALNEVYAAEFPYRLADWSSGSLASGKNSLWTMPLTLKNVVKMTLTWLWLFHFFRPWRFQRLPMPALVLGFRIVLKNQNLITSVASMKQVCFSLMTLFRVLSPLHAVLLWSMILASWLQDFQNSQNFSYHLPNTVRFHVRLIYLNWKGVAPSPTPRCSSYWKGSLLVALD